jgi:hypothetical protein
MMVQCAFLNSIFKVNLNEARRQAMLAKSTVHRLLTLVLFVVVLLTLVDTPAPTFSANEAVRGELNGWGFWNMTSNLGGTHLYTSDQILDADDPSSEFKFHNDAG